jgi:DNA-binding response OmpR family regulator
MSRILLVDDSVLFLEIAQVALEAEGYKVKCATTLDELEQARKEFACDLILMDVQMPEAFGDDVALALRGLHGVKTPIYLLSSLDEEDLVERVKWSQVDGYISKNHGIDAVLARVRTILAAPEGGE